MRCTNPPQAPFQHENGLKKFFMASCVSLFMGALAFNIYVGGLYFTYAVCGVFIPFIYLLFEKKIHHYYETNQHLMKSGVLGFLMTGGNPLGFAAGIYLGKHPNLNYGGGIGHFLGGTMGSFAGVNLSQWLEKKFGWLMSSSPPPAIDIQKTPTLTWYHPMMQNKSPISSSVLTQVSPRRFYFF